MPNEAARALSARNADSIVVAVDTTERSTLTRSLLDSCRVNYLAAEELSSSSQRGGTSPLTLDLSKVKEQVKPRSSQRGVRGSSRTRGSLQIPLRVG